MKLLDSRRLTGPNLIWKKPGAVIDVELVAGESPVIKAWQDMIEEMLRRLDWHEHTACVRHFSGGASLAISAPLDLLYVATDINEWCWQWAVSDIAGSTKPDFELALENFRQQIRHEANPGVTAIQQFAANHRLDFLCDDDAVSLGLGQYSTTWSVDALPGVDSLDPARYKAIPIGLITGTNGKTTSTRLAAHIAQCARLTVGISSTDWIAVNNDILDKGDYSGPGGARTVLRDRRVDLAILETARGGLLRRGLGVNRANAALITNIAADHMGEFGVQTLDELANVKWIVSSALDQQGKLILNADDPLLIARATNTNLDIAWFSPDADNPFVRQNIARGQWACTLEGQQVVFYAQGVGTSLGSIAEIPLTFGGAARHNVENVLGVVLLARALTVSLPHIETGLKSFSNADNPGRSNLFNINGARVIVDFAHNPHGMRAVTAIARHMPATRRLLVNGQAGDRSDADIRQLAIASVDGVHFDRIIIKLMEKYNRGRQTGETAKLLTQQFIDSGVDPSRISIAEEEIDAVKQAIDWARPGDLVLLLIHEDRQRVLNLLRQLEQGREPASNT